MKQDSNIYETDIMVEKLLQNGLRVLMTPRCNYDCFFCHNEGLDKNGAKQRQVDAGIVISFIREGVRDLTLSGGEPLLCFAEICELMQRITAELEPQFLKELELTIVTNGKVLDNKKTGYFADLSKKLKHLKFNVSLHSADRTEYDQVTRTTDNFDDVKNNIKCAINAGLDLRLNYVLLNNKNCDESDIKAMFSLAHELGADHIKLIEFLVTQQNSEFYSSYFRLRNLLYNYSHRAATIEKKSERCTTFFFKDEGITVDFVRCTCALGCRDCADSREIELTPGNKLMPCIAREDLAFNAKECTARELASKSAEQLKNMGKLYGVYSPSLVAPPENVAAKAVVRVAAKEFPAKANIQWLREYEYQQLDPKSGVTIDTPYNFHIEQLKGDGHSNLICSREEICREQDLCRKDVTFMDPIYEFSRTRASINVKKIKCMGYTVTVKKDITERTTLLSEPNDPNLKVYYRELTYLGQSEPEYLLEVYRIKGEDWPAGEPVAVIKRVAEIWDLNILPFENP
jgi:molybdenum cofactor biosynthesis enzyme MoaA